MFSIIIPTQNRAALLKVALNGVNAQTCPDKEIVIVDDASCADQAAEIDAIVGGSTVPTKLVRLTSSHPRGNGPSFSRNAGVAAANGQYIAFCDDDDVWTDPNHLDIAAQTFKTIPETEYYFADQIGVFQGETRVPHWLPALKSKMRAREPVFEAVYRVTLADIAQPNAFPHMNTTIVSRALFDRLGGFEETLRYSEDLHFSLRAMDGAAAISYRDAVVAQHNIPDRSAQNNASTILTARSKELHYLTICNQIRCIAKSSAVLDAIDAHAASSCKKLAEALAGEGRYAQAASFARLALGTAPTWKWRAYTTYITLKAAVSGR